MTPQRRFTESLGNVFADLGLPNAGTRLAKAELAFTIAAAIQDRSLTQLEAAAILEIDQPKVSAIPHGCLSFMGVSSITCVRSALAATMTVVDS